MHPEATHPAASGEQLPARSADSLNDAKRPIQPAVLTSSAVYSEDGYAINKMTFSVPFDHRGHPLEERITVTVRAVLGKADGQAGNNNDSSHRACPIQLTPDKPIAAYLCGGPGSDNPPLACPAMTDFYLAKGFQLLYMNYRGTGDSHELRADVFRPIVAEGKASSHRTEQQRPEHPRLAGLTPEEQAGILAHFRQDNIVRDLEAVRQCLSVALGRGGAQTLKLTLIGQSYGGWIAYTYLSFMPESLDMVLLTGGIPPVDQTAEQVYERTFRSTLAANDAFYRKYPAHVDIAKRVGLWIEDKTASDTIEMPGGGRLSRERFLCLGRTLGTTGGDASVRASLDACLRDITADGRLSADTLLDMEGWIRFEERPLYALLQETLYTEPHLAPSRWAAQRVAEAMPAYAWLTDGTPPPGERITFYAEHVFSSHYDDFQALRPLKQAAAILAHKTDWPPLFDPPQLARNRVPVAAISYRRDVFVDCGLSERTAAATASLVHEVNGELMHTAVRDKTALVCPRLWTLLGDAVAKARGLQADEVSAGDRASAASLLAVLYGEQQQ